MKIDIDELNPTYNTCLERGNIREKNAVDIELIKSLKNVAQQGLSFIKDKAKSIPKESLNWTFVFRDYYECLRGFIEAYLLFDKIEADTHQCKNAYLCFNHPELELNWKFLETARLKRNGINYKGVLVSFEEWNKLKLNFDLHMGKLVKEIEKKLKEFR